MNTRTTATLLYWVIVVSFCAVTPYLAEHSSWISEVANTPAPYVIAPFTIGLLAGRNLAVATAQGLLLSLLMVGVFYWADDLSSAEAFNATGLTAYAAQAVVVGPVGGLVGGLAARAGRTARIVVAGLVCGCVIAFQMTDILVPDTSRRVDDIALLLNVAGWSAASLLVASLRLREVDLT